MATYRGVAVNFGVSSTTITSPSWTGIFTTRDYNRRADNDLVRDGDGAATAKVFYNPYEEASFSFIQTSTHATSSLPINGSSNIPAVGDLATVADTTNFTLIAGTTWIVEEVSIKSTNTSVTVVDLKLNKYPGITA